MISITTIEDAIPPTLLPKRFNVWFESSKFHYAHFVCAIHLYVRFTLAQHSSDSHIIQNELATTILRAPSSPPQHTGSDDSRTKNLTAIFTSSEGDCLEGPIPRETALVVL